MMIRENHVDKGLLDLTYKSISHRNDVTNLQDEMVLLDKKLKTAKAESQKRDQSLDRAIMRSSQSEARGLVEMMDIMLPRELCHMVYSYLAVRDEVQHIGHVFPHNFWHPGDGSEYLTCNPPPPPPPPPPPFPYHPYHSENAHAREYVRPDERIFKPEYVSSDIATEVTKAYYRENTFSVTAHRHMPLLRRLLTHDRASLGMNPATLIRRLRIEIPVECCDRHRRRYPPSSEQEVKSRLGEFKMNFKDCLELIPDAQRANMHFALILTFDYRSFPGNSNSKDERKLLNILYAIRTIVYDQQQLGSKVTVYGKMHLGKDVDISHLFNQTPVDWLGQPSIPYVPFSATGEDPPIPPGEHPLGEVVHLQDARKEWGYTSFEDLILHPSLEDNSMWIRQGSSGYTPAPPPLPPADLIPPPLPFVPSPSP